MSDYFVALLIQNMKMVDFNTLQLSIFKSALPQATTLRENSKVAHLLRDLIKDTLQLIEEEEKMPWRQVD